MVMFCLERISFNAGPRTRRHALCIAFQDNINEGSGQSFFIWYKIRFAWKKGKHFRNIGGLAVNFLLVKKIPAILFIVFMLIMAACSVSGKKSAKAMKKLGPTLAGRWEGMLPCEDRVALIYELILQNDGSYQEKITRSLKDSLYETNRGKWTISKDSIIHIAQSKSGTVKYKFQNGRLEHTLSDKGMISSLNYKPVYVLTRLHDETTRRLGEMYRQGIFFMARDEGDTWSLNIDKNGKITFKSSSPEHEKLSTIKNHSQLMSFPDTIHIESTSYPKLHIILIKKVCMLSGQPADYAISVEEIHKNGKRSETYSGCGLFLSDQRLNDLWILESINKRSLRRRKEEEREIAMRIHLSSGRIYGYGACDSYHADTDIRHNSIIIGPVISTRSTCVHEEEDQRFFQSLAGKQFTYSIKKDKLYLRAGKLSLVFRQGQN